MLKSTIYLSWYRPQLISGLGVFLKSSSDAWTNCDACVEAWRVVNAWISMQNAWISTPNA